MRIEFKLLRKYYKNRLKNRLKSYTYLKGDREK